MDDSTAAVLMRNLDEDLRNWLIDQAGDKVIDLRPVFEKRSLDGHVVTMPSPWFDGDDIA